MEKEKCGGNRKSSLEHLIKRIEAKREAIKNRAKKMAKEERAVLLAHRNGNFAIVHPCTDGKNAWQISRFDQHGPYSDSRRKTYYECAEIAIEEGFRKIIDIDEEKTIPPNGRAS